MDHFMGSDQLIQLIEEHRRVTIGQIPEISNNSKKVFAEKLLQFMTIISCVHVAKLGKRVTASIVDLNKNESGHITQRFAQVYLKSLKLGLIGYLLLQPSFKD